MNNYPKGKFDPSSIYFNLIALKKMDSQQALNFDKKIIWEI